MVETYGWKAWQEANKELFLSGIHVDADDIMQEMAVLELTGRPIVMKKWKAQKLAKNAVRDEKRMKRGGGKVATIDGIQNEPGVESDVLGGLIAKEEKSQLVNAMFALEGNELTAVNLRYFHGLSLVECGESMGMTRSAFSGLLARAIDRMRRTMGA